MARPRAEPRHQTPIGKPTLPNKDKPPCLVSCEIQEQRVLIATILCPACGVMARNSLDERARHMLSTGKQVEGECNQCGQGLVIEGPQQRRIITPGMAAAMARAGR